MTWLNTNWITGILGLATAIAAALQIAYGADWTVLLLAIITVACGLFGFWLYGALNLAGWISLSYMTGNVFVALIAKTALGQTLNSNLYTPREAFLVQMICGLSLLIALVVVAWVNVGKPVMEPITDLTVLRLVSTWSILIGLCMSLVFVFVARLGDSSYGGLNILGSFLYYGIVTRTALIMLRSNGRRMIDPILLTVMLGSTMSGVLSTGKSEAAYPWVCYFLTILFFKGKLPRRYLALMVGGVALYLAIAPIMLTFRYMGLRSMPVDKEIEYLSTMPLLDSDELALLAAKHSHTKSLAYDYYGGGSGQLILGRFSSIQQSDPVIAAADMRGLMGGSVMADSFRSILPKSFAPDKPKESQAYRVIRELGLYRGGGGRPTVPLAAIVYSAYGMAGIVWIPFVTFLVYLLVLKKVGLGMAGNVFAIFLLAIHVSVTNGAGFTAYVQFLLRDLPILCGAIFLMQWLALLLTRRQREFAEVRA